MGMPLRSEAEAMRELASLLWTRFLRERVRGELNHEMNGYKAEVVSNNHNGTLTVKRAFEAANLTLKAAASAGDCIQGDQVIVVGIGNKATALSNAFVLCKADLSDTVKQDAIDGGSITFSAVWSGAGPYTQTVTVSNASVTNNSVISLRPTPAQITQLMSDGVLGITVENNSGTLTAYAWGTKPSTAMTMQCSVTELSN